MTPQALLDLVRTHVIDPSEFEDILSSHFGGAMHSAPNVIVYPGDASNFALRLTYAGDALMAIEGGPALKSEDVPTLIKHLETEVIVSAGSKVGATVLFAPVPVSGYFKFKDVFQILPVPQNAPRPQQAFGDHPFLLEFTFASSANWSLNIFRRSIIGRELELFISGVVGSAIHSMGFSAARHWVMTSESVNPLTIGYQQEMYTSPDILLERPEFSPLDEIPAIPQTSPQEFYAQRGISVGQVFALPDTFAQLYQIFAELSPEDRQRFLTSCFWYQHANRVHRHSRSAYFTALVSAIEALVPPPTGQSQCPTCKKMTGPGPTERFAQFLQVFAPGTGEMHRERKRLYGLRSALSHGGALLRSDYRTWTPGLTPAGVREWEDLSNAWGIVRVALVNWLGAHKTTSNETAEHAR